MGLTDENYHDYEVFREIWLDKNNSYVKFIQIRNNLQSIIPYWMETESFLKYEMNGCYLKQNVQN